MGTIDLSKLTPAQRNQLIRKLREKKLKARGGTFLQSAEVNTMNDTDTNDTRTDTNDTRTDTNDTTHSHTTHSHTTHSHTTDSSDHADTHTQATNQSSHDMKTPEKHRLSDKSSDCLTPQPLTPTTPKTPFETPQKHIKQLDSSRKKKLESVLDSPVTKELSIPPLGTTNSPDNSADLWKPFIPVFLAITVFFVRLFHVLPFYNPIYILLSIEVIILSREFFSVKAGMGSNILGMISVGMWLFRTVKGLIRDVSILIVTFVFISSLYEYIIIGNSIDNKVTHL